MVRLRVVCITGGSFYVDLGSSDSVADMKTQIKVAIGAPETQQRLIFKGQELRESQILSSCLRGTVVGGSACNNTVDVVYISGDEDVVSDAVYLLVNDQEGGTCAGVTSRLERRLLPAGREGVCVRTLFTDSVCVVDATPSELVQSVKAKIKDKLQLSGDHLLMFAGTELRDERTLVSYGISTAVGSTLHVLPRQAPDAPAPRTPVHANGPNMVSGTPARRKMISGAPVGKELVERQLDGTWFRARVLRYGGTPPRCTADIEYLDDGKIERCVDLSDCRIVGPVNSSDSFS